jgi:hypothetical protein
VGRPCHAAAGLGLEPESSSRSGTTPIGGVRLSVREGEGEEGSWHASGPSRGKEKLGRMEEEGKEELGCWARPHGGEKRKRLAGLGRAGGKEERERPGWAGPQGGKREGKRKRESGPSPIRKRGRKKIAFQYI